MLDPDHSFQLHSTLFDIKLSNFSFFKVHFPTTWSPNCNDFEAFTRTIKSWDDKILGIQLLIAQVTRENVRRDYVNPLLKYCRAKDNALTPGGLWWVSKWAPNRYAANSAFLCLMASEYDQSNTDAKDFATSQVHYFLGENPKKMR